MLINRNQHFLHVMTKEAGGAVLIGVKAMEEAKREGGTIGVEKLTGGAYRITSLKANGEETKKPLNIEKQLQEEINKEF